MPEDPETPAASDEPDGHEGGGEKIRALLPPESEQNKAEVTEDHVLSILASRRARERTFGRDLFADPAWDVLLELYAAKLGQRSVGLEDLARSIDIPRSTTGRWITALADRGWVVATGKTMGSIELSAAALSEMNRLIGYWGIAFRSI